MDGFGKGCCAAYSRFSEPVMRCVSINEALFGVALCGELGRCRARRGEVFLI